MTPESCARLLAERGLGREGEAETRGRRGTKMVRGHLFNPPAGVPSAADLFLRLRSLPARVGTVDCLMLVVCGLRLCVAPAGGAAAGRGAAGMHNGPRPAGDFPAWGGRDVPDVCRLAELGQECARAVSGNRANP
jgi:hypothetical protein